MCGIAGFIRRDVPEPVDHEVLRRMTKALSHRGPDDEGFFEQAGAFLGHRRLSVIDVGGGRQPIASEDGRVVVVFNGEIYNHHDLRHDLAARGHAFRTRSDTEVLVHMWEDEREAMVGRLNGMFAFAIWDSRDRTLLLARDRMGKKPLYWGLFDGEMVFGSELRALLAHPSVPREVDPGGLYRFLTLDYVPAPWSILRGVHKVDAAGYVLFSEGVAREGRYTDIRVPADPMRVKPAEAATRVWDTLCHATRRRLESEVPLGVFLSGGLDSAAVLAAMSADVPPSQIRTFTIGFEDPSYDESGPARAVAQHFGTDHHERVLRGDEAASLVRDCAGIADEPLADASVIPTYLLSKFAREHVTVALSGDGGDELFYGYPTFNADLPGDLAARLLPRPVRARWLPWLVSLLPTSDRDMSLPFKLDRFVRGLRFGRYERHFAWIGGFAPEDAMAVFSGDAAASVAGLAPYPDCSSHLAHCQDFPEVVRLAYLYSRLYLGEGVLAKVDRASMANGLEVRSPFLDAEMVRLAFALPPHLSFSLAGTKLLVRRMLAGRVPPAILKRPKKGFGMPLARWFRTDLAPLVNEVLAPRKIAREGFFRPEIVTRLVDLHRSGRANLRKELFSLVTFELWLSRYVL
ncbi:MAG: asparagine synthase (glutamine-hydrolyzing) [Deltaproteobacteria bacterium]|nr:asparagine synthase (glutamine-hydrolyzing) [Deltaproteobacteria bacterium]